MSRRHAQMLSNASKDKAAMRWFRKLDHDLGGPGALHTLLVRHQAMRICSDGRMERPVGEGVAP